MALQLPGEQFRTEFADTAWPPGWLWVRCGAVVTASAAILACGLIEWARIAFGLGIAPLVLWPLTAASKAFVAALKRRRKAREAAPRICPTCEDRYAIDPPAWSDDDNCCPDCGGTGRVAR